MIFRAFLIYGSDFNVCTDRAGICTNNDIKVHHVKYENVGFYLTIDNIRGYFNFSINNRILSMLFSDNEQQNKYH